MSGMAKCIADVLRGDITSVPASTFVTKYPLTFNAASAVPTFLYTSLKDIWLQNTTASGASAAQWSNYVVDTLSGVGIAGQSVGNRTIEVLPNRVLPQEDGPNRNNPRSNDTGAEWAEIFIYLKMGGTLTSFDKYRCYDAEMRIQRLIDYQYRTNTTGTPEIPITSNSLDSSKDVKAHWIGTVGQASKDLYLAYDTFYTKLFLK